MIHPRKLLQATYKAAANTVNHDGIEHAGYLAFLGLLALFPYLVFIVSLAGFLGEGKAGSDFITFLLSNLPDNIVDALRPRIEEIISGPPQGLLTVAILGTIWTSSSAVEGYRTVLNRAYHVSTPPAYLLRRLLSIVQLLIFSFVLIVGMLLLVIAPVIWEKITLAMGLDRHAYEESWSRLIWLATSFGLLLVVSYAYYILPNIKQRFLSVLPGAVIVVVMWTGAAKLLSTYLMRAEQISLVYGSIGGIIATLLFFYISNVIFIFGAEWNYLLKKAVGERIVQKEETTEPQPLDDEN